MKHCAANMSIPTVELPPSETLDVLGFARGCAQVLNALIQSFAVQSELSPVETVESLLGLKDCLARLEAWNVALSGAASKLNPSTPSSAPLARIAKALLRLSSQLAMLGRLLSVDTGMFFIVLPGTCHFYRFGGYYIAANFTFRGLFMRARRHAGGNVKEMTNCYGWTHWHALAS